MNQIDESSPSPVVGAAGLDVPTSGDVHLYSDPKTRRSDNPIMYANCEGLEGGEREPLGARLKRKDKPSRAGRIDSFERKVQNLHHTSEREIVWADTNQKRSREFMVTHLYPRLLHTFSDVVVFVLKNPRSVSLEVLFRCNFYRPLCSNLRSCQGHRKCLRETGGLGRSRFGEFF